MPNLPQPLCSAEAAGPSKQRAAARLEEKIIQTLPHHASPSTETQLEQGRASPRKEYWRKTKGDWQLLLFRDCLSLQHLLPHLEPGWTWAVLRGSSFSCSLHGAGAALRGCSGTRRGARGFLHSVPAHTLDLQDIQQEFIHHGNGNLSITPKCTETP